MKIAIPITAVLTLALLVPQLVLAQPPAPAQPAAPPAPPPITDPLVHALLETKPSTPEEMLRATVTLIDLKHPHVAKQFVQQLLAANLAADVQTKLVEQVGSAALLKIGTQPELQPEGRQLADAILATVEQLARDPARIAQSIAQLQDPATRGKARAELQTGGNVAAAALIAVLADAGRGEEHAEVRTALVRMGAPVTPLLIGALDSPDAAVKAQAIEVLLRLSASSAADYFLAPAVSSDSPPEVQAAARAGLRHLYGSVPSHATAVSRLYQKVRTLYDQVPLSDPDPASQVVEEVWFWDPQQNTVVPQTLSTQAATMHRAARLAKDLYSLEPNHQAVRRVYLGTQLEAASYTAGLDQPLPTGPGTASDEAAAAGWQELEDLLADSLATGHIPAATATARLLGDNKRPPLLASRGSRPAVLVEAATHPDRRLRFAAAEAVLKQQPREPFHGGSHLADAMTFFAGTLGASRAMVLETRLDDARQLAAFLTGLEYEVDVATRPVEFFERLITHPDYELVLIEYRLESGRPAEIIQRLRSDYRTALLPVGLVASPQDELAARRIAGQDAFTQVVVQPPTQEALAFQVPKVLAVAGTHRLSPQEKLAQAQAALDWLSRMLAARPELFGPVRATEAASHAIHVPELSAAAANVLAEAGTPRGQLVLVDIASQLTLPLERRQAAAAGFQKSVAQHGVRLTSAAILHQYDRYNLSETQPVETQQVLGSLLDTIENRGQPPASEDGT